VIIDSLKGRRRSSAFGHGTLADGRIFIARLIAQFPDQAQWKVETGPRPVRSANHGAEEMSIAYRLGAPAGTMP
jgi:hypothetical protein